MQVLSIRLACLLVLIITAPGLGSSHMAPERVVLALLGLGQPMDMTIIWTLRLPRILLALLAGVALALAGALLQRALRNPMASPSILGVTDGAAVGVVAFLWLFSDTANNLTVSIHWQPLAATLGATGFAVLVFVLSRHAETGSRPGSLTIILHGIALAALAKALVTLLMILGPIYRANQALTWLTGSGAAAHWSDVFILAIGLLIAFPLLVAGASSFQQMQLDDDTALATGLSVDPVRLTFLAVSVGLTALAVSQVGAVGFIGLIAPHAARLLTRSRSASYLISVALIGALLLLSADTLGRLVLPPYELPAGALTSFAGAPLFLYLLLKGQRSNG